MAEQLEQQGEYSFGSVLGQAALGTINEALLGFPRWLLDREQKGLFKPEDTKAEKFARGLGSFVGFAGLPGALFLKGGKLAGKVAVKAGVKGALKTAAAKGAGGFAAYELLRAPDDKFSEKFKSVPLATAIGATFGVTGAALSPVIKKHSKNLYNNITKKGTPKEYKGILDRIAKDTVSLIDRAEEKYLNLLKKGKFDKAYNFSNKIFTGTKRKLAEAQFDLAQTKDIIKDPVKRKLLLTGDAADLASLKMHGIGKLKANIYKHTKNTVDAITSNKLISSSREYMNRQGTAGKKFTVLADSVRDKTDKQAGNAVANYAKATLGFTDDELFHMVDVMEGKALPSSKKIENAINTINAEMGAISTSAKNNVKRIIQNKGNPRSIQKAAIEAQGFHPRDNYFPHLMLGQNAEKLQINQMISAGLKRGDFESREQGMKIFKEYLTFSEKQRASKAKNLFKYIAKTHNISESEAESRLNVFIKRTTNPKHGNLEHSRVLNLPFYDPHPDRVIPRYYTGAHNRLNEITHWGQENEVMSGLINEMKKDGADFKYAEHLRDRFTGAEAQRAAGGGLISPATSGAMRAVQVITKLGLSVIPNSTQTTNTAMVTNVRDTAKNISRFMSKAKRSEMRDFALRSGATLESSLNDFFSGTGLSGSIKIGGVPLSAQGFLKKTGFIWMEKMNRTIAANAGRDHAARMAERLAKNPTDKLAQRALKQLKLDSGKILKRNGQLTVDEMLTAAQQVVNKSQFRAGPLDLPLFFTSAEGKLVTQFKSFAFNQAKMIKDILRDEVSKGNMRPLVTALIAMPILGEGVKDVRAILTGRVRDEKGLERIIENISAVGAAGMFNDVLSAVKYNNVPGFMVGPSLSDAGRAVTSGTRAVQGKPAQLERFILGNVPVVGQLLKNTFVPTRRLKAARKRREKLKNARAN